MDALLLSCFTLLRFLCLAGQSFNLGIMFKLVDSGWPAAMVGSGGPIDFRRDLKL